MQKNLNKTKNELQIEQKYISFHQGPLPSPNDFKNYGEILPSAPERILKMAEKEQEYRFKRETKEILISFILVISCLITCIIAMYFKFPYVAGVIGGTTIIGVLSIILLKNPPKK